MDIKEQYEELTKILKEVVPFSALPIRELVQELRKKGHTITLKTELIVKDVLIVEMFLELFARLNKKNDEIIACGLTHLIISSKQPLFFGN